MVVQSEGRGVSILLVGMFLLGAILVLAPSIGQARGGGLVAGDGSPVAGPTPTVTALGYASNLFGTQTVGPFNAKAHDLLYLAIAEDYSNGDPPTLTSPGLLWIYRMSGAASGEASTWLYTAPVLSGGLSNFSFSIDANDNGGIGYILVDLRGYGTFDSNATNPSAAVYSSSSPSTKVQNSDQAVCLAFVSITAVSSSVTITPRTGDSVLNANPGPSYSVSLVYRTLAAGRHVLGGTVSTSVSGWVLSDAVDVSGASILPRITALAMNLNQFGTQTLGPVSVNKTDLLYLAITEDYSNGGAPTITSTGVSWHLRTSGAKTGDASLWIYTATVKKSGLLHYSFTVAPNDGGGIGYLLVDLHGYGTFDSATSNPGAHYFTGKSVARSIASNSSALDLLFVGVVTSSGHVLLTADAGQALIDHAPAPSYAVALIYQTVGAGATTIGGKFSASETGWVAWDAVDL